MQRPSSAKLWQMPQPAALPIIPLFFPREVPLEAHETSYFADSAKILNFSNTFSSIPTLIFTREHTKFIPLLFSNRKKSAPSFPHLKYLS